MATNPIGGISPIGPKTDLQGLENAQTEAAKTEVANSPAKKPVKPPLERPFSLSLPPEAVEPSVKEILQNIDEINQKTHENTLKAAEKAELKEILDQKLLDEEIANKLPKNQV
jgi:hypothetical protein